MTGTPAPLASQAFVQSADAEIENDPLYKAMEAFMTYSVHAARCFNTPKTWPPLRMIVEEMENGDVQFEISSETIVNIKRMEKNLPSYEAVAENGKRLKCAYWEVEAKQNSDGCFVANRTDHHHIHTAIQIRGDDSGPRPTIGYGSETKSYNPSLGELVQEFSEAALELLEPAQRTKFQKYLAMVPSDIFAPAPKMD